MANRNPQIPHSTQSLLYVERRGKYCGYKPELITDSISIEWEKFLICTECKGISRSARQVGGNTVCEMCVTGTAGNLDERVENKVLSLNSRCPLSGNGCDWEGVLGGIEQHMEVCTKVLVECQLKCGIIFERETTEQHSKEECPLRIIECQYCREEIQVKEENQHIGECVNHPDTEVPCPYKELGCDVITLRKNKDIHLTENMIGHQKLMLDQLSQLRNRNQQLKKRISKNDRDKRLWVLLTLVAAGIACLVAAVIGIAVAASLGNGIKYNSQQIQAIKESTSHISEYISGRGKVLPGIGWIHSFGDTGSIYGPTFYLGQCRLRLRAHIIINWYNWITIEYYVERLEGDYDALISSCQIRYTYVTYGYLDDIKPKYTYSSDTNTYLRVGNTKFLSTEYWKYSNRKVIIRAYFDTEGS